MPILGIYHSSKRSLNASDGCMSHACCRPSLTRLYHANRDAPHIQLVSILGRIVYMTRNIRTGMERVTPSHCTKIEAIDFAGPCICKFPSPCSNSPPRHAASTLPPDSLLTSRLCRLLGISKLKSRGTWAVERSGVLIPVHHSGKHNFGSKLDIRRGEQVLLM